MTENENKLLWTESHGGLKREGMTPDRKWRVTLALTLENAIRGAHIIDVTVWGGAAADGAVPAVRFDFSGGFDAAKKAAQEFIDAQGDKLTVRPGDVIEITAPEAPEPLPTFSLVKEQAEPMANNMPAVWPMVIRDMMDRDAEGRRKYGVPLQPHNGRDVLVDAYQEALDLCVYLRQAIYERDSK